MMPVAALAGIAAPQIDADLMTWARQCAEPPDSKYLMAHHRLVQQAKADGWWTTLSGIRFLNAPGTDGYLINVKTPTERMTAYGTASQNAYYGWQGDGSTAYLDTGKTPAQLGMTAGATPSITAMVYSQSDLPGVYSACGATIGVSTGVIRLRGGGPTMGVWGSSRLQVVVGSPSGRGLAGVVIDSTSGGFVQKNGTSTPILATAASLATGTFRYGRAGNSGTYEVAQLAYGFDGPSVTQSQADSIHNAVETALKTLDAQTEDEPEIPVTNLNAFERTDTGDWTGTIGRILQPPMSDTQENVTQYTRVRTAITWTANKYTTVAGDLGTTLEATSGEVAKTVTLMSAVTAGADAIQVVRKIDRGSASVTVNGYALSEQYAYVVYISDGAAWNKAQDYIPSVNIVLGYAITFTADAYTTVVADLGRNLQATAGATNKTVTLLTAATSNAGNDMFVRKVDSGIGIVTVNGVALANKGDWVYFVSNGTTWTRDVLYRPDSEWASNDYTAIALDLGRNIHAYSGSTNRTVTLMSAASAGNGSSVVVRKMDTGVGTITVEGVVLSEMYDFASFESNGAIWTQDQTIAPLEVGFIAFPATLLAIRPWGHPAYTKQTLITLDEFFWGTRGLGDVPGTITAYAKKGNDTMGGIGLTDGSGASTGFSGRTEFDTYQLAMGEMFVKGAYTLGYLPRNDTTLTTFDGNYRAGGWGFLDIAEQFGYDVSAWAAHVSSTVTNAVDNGAGLVRITTSAAHGITTGNTVTVANVVGVGAANTTAVATVINTTTFDLVGTTFSGTYASAGTVKNDTVLTTDVNVNTGAVGHWRYFRTNANAIFVNDAVGGAFKAVRNVIILGQGRLSDVRARGNSPVGGLFLDLEWADGRSAAQFERSIKGLARLCHAKNYTLNATSHAVHKGTGTYSGWRKSNANALLTSAPGVDGIDENIDLLALLTYQNKPTAQAMVDDILLQMNFFRGVDGTLPVPISKLALELRVGGHLSEIKVDYIDALRSLRTTYGFTHCWITPLYARFGGSLERIPNQRLAQFLGEPTS
jgi:hypothetical protein